MKILVTGLTAKQRGSGRPALFLLLDAVTLALRSLGHEVDREVRLDIEEDLSQYDAAIVALAPFGQTSCINQKFQQLRVCLDLPHVVAYDDWRWKETFGPIAKGNTDAFWRLRRT